MKEEAFPSKKIINLDSQAKELGIHYFACGHHATERYGVQALGAKVQQEFGIEVAFFDDHNPA